MAKKAAVVKEPKVKAPKKVKAKPCSKSKVKAVEQLPEPKVKAEPKELLKVLDKEINEALKEAETKPKKVKLPKKIDSWTTAHEIMNNYDGNLYLDDILYSLPYQLKQGWKTVVGDKKADSRNCVEASLIISKLFLISGYVAAHLKDVLKWLDCWQGEEADQFRNAIKRIMSIDKMLNEKEVTEDL